MNAREQAIRYKKAIENAAQETAISIINESQFLDHISIDNWLDKLRTREEFQEEGKDWITDYLNALRARLRMHVLVMPNSAAERSLENLAYYKPFNDLDDGEPVCPVSYQKLGKGKSAVGVPLSTGRLYDAESIAKWVLVENKKVDPMSREPLTRGDIQRVEKYRPLLQKQVKPGEMSPGRMLAVFGLGLVACLGGGAIGIIVGGIVGGLIGGPPGAVAGMFTGAVILAAAGVAAVVKINNWLLRREANRHVPVQNEAIDLDQKEGDYHRLDEVKSPSPRVQDHSFFQRDEKHSENKVSEEKRHRRGSRI